MKLSHVNCLPLHSPFFYRPPSSFKYSQAISIFLDEFQTLLSSAATTPHEFIVTGDFNIHLDYHLDSSSQQFTDLLSSTNLTAKTNNRLQLLQNSLARAITRTPKLKIIIITPKLKSLHWLKIEECIHCKIISLTYDSLHTLQPQYLRKLINIKHAGSTRSSNHLTLLRPSTTSSLKISNRSYNQTAPILWNNLPKSMKTFSNTSPKSATTSQCTSLPLSLSKTKFCSHLKTYLFGISYPP